MIRLTIPSLSADDIEAMEEVVATGYLVQGPKVASFEAAVASYVGAPYAIAVSNCTAALHLALLALDVRAGDIVLVTAYSWIATANVIELCGAQPIFIDIEADTFNMDPNCLEATLTQLMKNPSVAARVKAILPVHTFGQMANMPAILEIANSYNLPVVEDAACALGATWQGIQAGTWGIMGCFSFHPRKAITTGEGGMIVTADPQLARLLRMLRNHGLDPDASSSDFVLPGFNYRLTEFQAALGLTQMQKVDRIIQARRQAAARYNNLLAATDLQAPVVAPESNPVHQSYVALLQPPQIFQRDQILSELRAQGIECTIGTIHMPLTTYFRSRYQYEPGMFPVTDSVAAASITLPLYETIALEDQVKVVDALRC